MHGHNNILGAVIFPHNIGMGCTRNAALVEKVERVTAEEVRATGIQWAFAPCVTVPQDERWGRTYEGFSEDPQLVREMAGAAVRGFQGTDLANPLSVLACAKHFVGDGGTAFGSAHGGRGLDQGDTRVDEATLRRIHLQGYIAAVQAGVGSIMPSYSSWNGVKVSGNRHLLTEILKQELGFQGFLISDYNAIDQVDRDYKKAIGISINAGMDMAMVPSRYKEYIANLTQLVDEGVVPMARIDDAVTRILRVKFAMGLMDQNRSQLADRGLHKTFGSAEHRQVAREAVRQSLVLLKNQNKVLPLKKTAARIHVGGKSADDLGNQCGGWTIDWQGKSGEVTPGGTTVLAAIRQAVSKGTQVTFSKDGTGAAGATRRGGGDWRAAVRRRERRPHRSGAGSRGRGRGCQHEGGGDSGGGDPVLGTPHDPRRRAGESRCRGGRVAAGHRRRRNRGRAVRRLPAHGETLVRLAALHGAGGQAPRRQGLRSAVRVRVRAELVGHALACRWGAQ